MKLCHRVRRCRILFLVTGRRTLAQPREPQRNDVLAACLLFAERTGTGEAKLPIRLPELRSVGTRSLHCGFDRAVVFLDLLDPACTCVLPAASERARIGDRLERVAVDEKRARSSTRIACHACAAIVKARADI